VMILAGFIRAWQLQTGMTAVPFPQGLMNEIDSLYAPLIDHLIYEKKPE
jgi:hypothetical protein